jgi:hypothetical protein
MAEFASPRRTRRAVASPSAGNPSTPFSARKKRSLECVLSPDPASRRTVKASELPHAEDEIRRNKKRPQAAVRESLFASENAELEPALVVEILNEESQERKCELIFRSELCLKAIDLEQTLIAQMDGLLLRCLHAH